MENRWKIEVVTPILATFHGVRVRIRPLFPAIHDHGAHRRTRGALEEALGQRGGRGGHHDASKRLRESSKPSKTDEKR